MSLSHTFVLNLKLERLCLAKKILKDCGSSTRPRVSPMEFPSTHSALATIIPYTAFYDWFKKTQKKSRQLDEMIARLDEIGKDLKEANRKIDSLTNALLKANSKVEKAAIEYKLRDKEYKKLEKKYNALLERLSTTE